MSSAIPFALLGGLYAVAAFLSLHSGGAREVVAAFLAAAANPGGGSLVVRGAANPRVAREEARRLFARPPFKASLSLTRPASHPPPCPPAPPAQAHLLTLLSGFMATAETAASAWVHLLSLDLFVARHVYLDSLATGTPATHSLALCCMFGPCGFLSHALTKAVLAARRPA